MEAITRETAFLIEKLIEAGLEPLRREGTDTDAAARRVLRCSSTLSTSPSRTVLLDVMPRVVHPLSAGCFNAIQDAKKHTWIHQCAEFH